jgi:hypothetical protein
MIKTVVQNNSKNNMNFRIWKPFCSHYKEGLGKSLRDIEISNNALKKQAKIFPLLDPKNVINIIPLRKVAFYQLKQCHIPQGLNQELQNLPFTSSSPLTTKHSDRYTLRVAPIIDLSICFEVCCHVTSKTVNCNCHLSTVMTSKLQLRVRPNTDRILIPAVCKCCSSHIGYKNLWICYQRT